MSAPYDELPVEPNVPTCPYCATTAPPTFLGILGTLAHFRCRQCGATYDENGNEE